MGQPRHVRFVSAVCPSSPGIGSFSDWRKHLFLAFENSSQLIVKLGCTCLPENISCVYVGSRWPDVLQPFGKTWHLWTPFYDPFLREVIKHNQPD